MTATSPVHSRHVRSHMPWLPHTPLGKWGFGLMLLAAVAGAALVFTGTRVRRALTGQIAGATA